MRTPPRAQLVWLCVSSKPHPQNPPYTPNKCRPPSLLTPPPSLLALGLCATANTARGAAGRMGDGGEREGGGKLYGVRRYPRPEAKPAELRQPR